MSASLDQASPLGCLLLLHSSCCLILGSVSSSSSHPASSSCCRVKSLTRPKWNLQRYCSRWVASDSEASLYLVTVVSERFATVAAEVHLCEGSPTRLSSSPRVGPWEATTALLVYSIGQSGAEELPEASELLLVTRAKYPASHYSIDAGVGSPEHLDFCRLSFSPSSIAPHTSWC